MNFDRLPPEIIVKIAASCHHTTNYRLTHTNKRTSYILKRAGLPPPFLRKLTLGLQCFEVVESNGSSINYPMKCHPNGNSLLKYLKNNKIEAIMKISMTPGAFDLSCFTLLSEVFMTGNPVKSIERFEHVGSYCGPRELQVAEKFREYSTGELEKYKVKSITFNNYKTTILYDEYLNKLPIHLDIEFRDDQLEILNWTGSQIPSELFMEDLTDDTLKKLLKTKRKVFKFSGYASAFSSVMLAETIETALLNNWNVDWELGFIREPQHQHFKKLENISGLSLDWEQNNSSCGRYMNYKLSKGRAIVRFASTVNLLR